MKRVKKTGHKGPKNRRRATEEPITKREAMLKRKAVKAAKAEKAKAKIAKAKAKIAKVKAFVKVKEGKAKVLLSEAKKLMSEVNKLRATAEKKEITAEKKEIKATELLEIAGARMAKIEGKVTDKIEIVSEEVDEEIEEDLIDEDIEDDDDDDDDDIPRYRRAKGGKIYDDEPGAFWSDHHQGQKSKLLKGKEKVEAEKILSKIEGKVTVKTSKAKVVLNTDGLHYEIDKKDQVWNLQPTRYWLQKNPGETKRLMTGKTAETARATLEGTSKKLSPAAKKKAARQAALDSAETPKIKKKRGRNRS